MGTPLITYTSEFFLETHGLDRALEIVEPLTRAFQIGDLDAMPVPTGSPSVIDHQGIAAAIEAALHCDVGSVSELLPLRALECPDWATREQYQEGLRGMLEYATMKTLAGQLHFHQKLQKRFEPIVDAPRHVQEMKRFNRFLDEVCDVAIKTGEAFSKAIRRRMAMTPDEFDACIRESVRWPIYYYLALRYVGHKDAEDLVPLIRLLPRAVPIWAKDSTGAWVAILF